MGHKNRDGATLTLGTRRIVRAAAVCALLALHAPGPTLAEKGNPGVGNCQLTARGEMDFGPYDPFAFAPVLFDAPAFDYRCSGRDLEIEIDYGAAGASPRRMANGADSLAYLLFQDPARTVPWDGPLAAPSDGTLWLYGTLPARQDVSAGAYADTVVVTFYP
jgi:spore coat protein U-like protein